MLPICIVYDTGHTQKSLRDDVDIVKCPYNTTRTPTSPAKRTHIPLSLDVLSIFLSLHPTASQYKGKYQCRGVLKNLKKCFFFLWHSLSMSAGVSANVLAKLWRLLGSKFYLFFLHIIARIHSFPTMYNTWGCSLRRNGSKQWFSPKSDF